MSLNVKSQNILSKLSMLNDAGEFKRYPTSMLRNNARVRVNHDSYLEEDDFIIVSPYFNLPREIYIYGKKTRSSDEDSIYLNYWMPVFLNTVENGTLNYGQFEKSFSKYEMTIGLPYLYRCKAYGNSWQRENIIEFLSCLFNVKLEQANYQQEDLLDLMVA